MILVNRILSVKEIWVFSNNFEYSHNVAKTEVQVISPLQKAI